MLSFIIYTELNNQKKTKLKNSFQTLSKVQKHPKNHFNYKKLRQKKASLTLDFKENTMKNINLNNNNIEILEYGKCEK